MSVPTPPRDNPRAIRAALYEHVTRTLSPLSIGPGHTPIPSARLVRLLDRLSAVRIIGCLGPSPADTMRNLVATEAEAK